MKSYAFFNQKGGVSKTSTALLAIDYFRLKKKRVLAIDLDPQASISRTLIPDYSEFIREKNNLSISEVLQGNITDLSNVVKSYNGVDLLPAKISMSRLPIIDSTDLIRIKKEVFESFMNKYDTVIIDNPPSLSHFSRLGILLSNWVLIPLYLERYSFEGIEDALYTIQSLVGINPDFEGYWAFISRKTERKIGLHQTFEKYYYDMLEDHILKYPIPDFIGIGERTLSPKSIFEAYDLSNEKIEKIINFFKELEKKTNGKKRV